MAVEAVDTEPAGPHAQIDPDDWNWSTLVEILSGRCGAEHRKRATRALRGLQGSSFEKLRDAIEDPDHVTSWEDPWLTIRIDHPWDWIQKQSKDSYLSGERPAKPEFHEELIPFDLLLAGAGVILDGEMEYPSIPIPLLTGSGRVPPGKEKVLFERWIDFDEWMSPVSYGDRFNGEDDIKKGSIAGKGSGVRFRAALAFFLYPHVIDSNTETAYYDVRVGLPWVSSHAPSLWTEEEKAALWETVLRLLDTLVREIDDNEPLPKKVLTKVEAGPNSEAKFQLFSALIDRPAGDSIAELTSVRTVEKTSLRRFPPYALGCRGPSLDITDGEGALTSMATMEVLSVMFYPDDASLRQRFLEAHRAFLVSELLPEMIEKKMPEIDLDDDESWLIYQQAVLSHLSEFKLSRRMLSKMLNAPPYMEILGEALERRQAAFNTGEMLLYLICCAQYNPEHATITKAALLRSWDLKGHQDADGRQVGRKRSKLIRDWATFKPVAHLWAAFRLCEEQGFEESGFVLVPGSETNFLAVAEEVRRLGEKCFARAQASKHGPALNPAETWRSPPDLPLPSVTYEIPTLKDTTLRRLAESSKSKSTFT